MICIVTVIKNEQNYLEEWIKYHLNLGIDHIFIFEDIGSKSHYEITSKYNKVSLNNINILRPIDKCELRQIAYFQEAIQWIKNNYNYDWCFAIDCDEYITLEDKNNIKSILDLYSDYDAVMLQWENYNANGHIFKPDYSKKGILDTYTQKCSKSKDPDWKNRKVVYKLKSFEKRYFCGVHLCNKSIKWCKTDFSNKLNGNSYNNIYLRHYITKSWEEYVWKLKIRGMFSSHRNYDDFFYMNPDLLDKKEELLKIAENNV